MWVQLDHHVTCDHWILIRYIRSLDYTFASTGLTAHQHMIYVPRLLGTFFPIFFFKKNQVKLRNDTKISSNTFWYSTEQWFELIMTLMQTEFCSNFQIEHSSPNLNHTDANQYRHPESLNMRQKHATNWDTLKWQTNKQKKKPLLIVCYIPGQGTSWTWGSYS